jgi:hypothetical protein
VVVVRTFASWLAEEHRHYELAAFERPYVLGRQLEPFAVFSPRRKTSLPISLNTLRVISTNRVYSGCLFRKLDGKLPFSPANRVGSSNFKVPSGSNQVNKAKLFPSINIYSWRLAFRSTGPVQQIAKMPIPLRAALIAVRAFCHGRPKTRQWRSPVPQSDENLFLSVNTPTLFDRFRNDAALGWRIGALIWRMPVHIPQREELDMQPATNTTIAGAVSVAYGDNYFAYIGSD